MSLPSPLSLSVSGHDSQTWLLLFPHADPISLSTRPLWNSPACSPLQISVKKQLMILVRTFCSPPVPTHTCPTCSPCPNLAFIYFPAEGLKSFLHRYSCSYLPLFPWLTAGGTDLSCCLWKTIQFCLLIIKKQGWGALKSLFFMHHLPSPELPLPAAPLDGHL